jgi:hypothetical protein
VRRPGADLANGLALKRCNGQLIDIDEDDAEAVGGLVVLVVRTLRLRQQRPASVIARRGVVLHARRDVGLDRVTMPEGVVTSRTRSNSLSREMPRPLHVRNSLYVGAGQRAGLSAGRITSIRRRATHTTNMPFLRARQLSSLPGNRPVRGHRSAGWSRIDQRPSSGRSVTRFRDPSRASEIHQELPTS